MPIVRSPSLGNCCFLVARVIWITRKLLAALYRPPGQAGMQNFRGGLALDLVDLGRFQAARVGYHRYSTRFDINSTLICLMAVSFNTVSTLLRRISGPCSFL